MNKKLIVFICILSLLVPFLPQFDFVVHADGLPNVSNDNLEEWQEWLAENGLMQDPQTGQPVPISNSPISLAINKFLFDNGYVVKDDFSVIVDSLQSITGINILEHGGLDSLKSYAEDNNFTSISQNIINNSITYASDNLSYYVYDFINIDDFFNYYQFLDYPTETGYQGISSFKLALENLCSDSSYVYMLSTEYSTYSQAKYLYRTHLIKIPRDYFDDNYLALRSGQFSGIQNYPFQSFRKPRDGATIPTFSNFGSSYLRVFDGLEYVTRDDSWTIYRFKNSANGNWYNGYETLLGEPSYAIYTGLINNSSSWFNGSFNGTVFIYSGQSFSLPVFKSTNLVSDFASGNANVYKFNSSLSLPDGVDIDYSRLYDLISDSVANNTGNVIDSINNVVDKYLQQQLDLLHDINNALNDGSGQSWLRRIYGILDYNFPLTLQAFEDLQQAIQNISISGGGSDLTHINRVLDEINAKLGFMIEEPLTDADVQDMEDLKNLASQKFPFCVFSDIVAISVILNQTPEQPHWQIPLKLPGSSSANNIEVDLSWYEEVRDLVQGVFIFIFIVGLLALSVKIFSALKS